MKNSQAVVLKNLSYTYPGGRGVSKCTLTVPRGSIYGLLGHNGSGKSTLMYVVAGLVNDYEGEAKVLGKEVKHNLNFILDKVCYVPQRIALIEDFTVEENFHFFGELKGLSRLDIEKRMDELVGGFALKKYRKAKVSELSGGYKRLVNFAISLLKEGEVFIFDEPTANLDKWIKKYVLSYIKGLKKKGKTSIIITHEFGDTEELLDKVGLMIDGTVVMEDKLRDLIRNYGGGYLVRVYFKEKDLPLKKIRLGNSYGLISEDRLVVFVEDHIEDALSEIKEVASSMGLAIDWIDVREPSLNNVLENVMEERR